MIRRVESATAQLRNHTPLGPLVHVQVRRKQGLLEESGEAWSLLKRGELLGAPDQTEDTQGHLRICMPPQHTHRDSKDSNWKPQARCKHHSGGWN